MGTPTLRVPRPITWGPTPRTPEFCPNLAKNGQKPGFWGGSKIGAKFALFLKISGPRGALVFGGSKTYSQHGRHVFAEAKEERVPRSYVYIKGLFFPFSAPPEKWSKNALFLTKNRAKNVLPDHQSSVCDQPEMLNHGSALKLR